jgi:hypothetical protein
VKRSGFKRSTPLKRLSGLSRDRKPIKQVSLKRAATLPARRACVRIVLERDQGCVFERRLEAYITPWGEDPSPLRPGELSGVPRSCWGPLDVHEPGHRSQGADPTDPTACICLCRGHHDYAHAHPRFAKALKI